MRAVLPLLALALALPGCSWLAPEQVGGDHDRLAIEHAAREQQEQQIQEAVAQYVEGSESAGAGAKSSLNDNFRSADLDVADYIRRFEGESREIAVERDGLVAACALQPGEALGDIGAGTGLFLAPFHEAVGADGKVYAVDISEGFMEHMQERIAEEGLDRVVPVLCDERSARLPEDSVDALFICDTYHHFEHPFDTLASLRSALRPGGRMIIVDFERIPGVTREWLLGHVRCDKQTVIDEVTAAGFVLDAELDVEGLSENYVLRFVLPE